jgi:hypothetical protein
MTTPELTAAQEAHAHQLAKVLAQALEGGHGL